MSKKTLYAVLAAIGLCLPTGVSAQFNTVKKTTNPGYIILDKLENSMEEIDVETQPSQTTKRKKRNHRIINDSVSTDDSSEFRRVREKYSGVRRRRPKQYRSDSLNVSGVTNVGMTSKTAGLTLESLYQEILKNNIQHPKVVLAQAVLETGWFKSSVCRNKGNLFGLRNPKTGGYYEFENWRDSVKAYYTKVQYKYKDKTENYLLWLKRIGYAEDKGYIEAVMRVMKTLKVV